MGRYRPRRRCRPPALSGLRSLPCPIFRTSAQSHRYRAPMAITRMPITRRISTSGSRRWIRAPVYAPARPPMPSAMPVGRDTAPAGWRTPANGQADPPPGHAMDSGARRTASITSHTAGPGSHWSGEWTANGGGFWTLSHRHSQNYCRKLHTVEGCLILRNRVERHQIPCNHSEDFPPTLNSSRIDHPSRTTHEARCA